MSFKLLASIACYLIPNRSEFFQNLNKILKRLMCLFTRVFLCVHAVAFAQELPKHLMLNLNLFIYKAFHKNESIFAWRYPVFLTHRYFISLKMNVTKGKKVQAVFKHIGNDFDVKLKKKRKITREEIWQRVTIW